jgi:AraC-like DNA-binding protein
LYVGTDVLPERLIGAAIDHPAIDDLSLIADLSRLHRHLVDSDDLFAGEKVFDRVAARIRSWLTRTAPRGDRPDPTAATCLRDVLDQRLFEPVTLADCAATIGLSVGHASRAFTTAFGLSPHAYVVSRRVDRARRLLIEGATVADSASATGFHDQAHLTRHFRRHVGTTPARFRTRRA